MKRQRSFLSTPLVGVNKLCRQNTQMQFVDTSSLRSKDPDDQEYRPGPQSGPPKSKSVTPSHRTLVANINGVSYRSEMWIHSCLLIVVRRRIKRILWNGRQKKMISYEKQWASWENASGRKLRNEFLVETTCSVCRDGKRYWSLVFEKVIGRKRRTSCYDTINQNVLIGPKLLRRSKAEPQSNAGNDGVITSIQQFEKGTLREGYSFKQLDTWGGYAHPLAPKAVGKSVVFDCWGEITEKSSLLAASRTIRECSEDSMEVTVSTWLAAWSRQGYIL